MYSVRGNRVQYSMFGESHGPFIGMTIHGFPEGIAIDFKAIDAALSRRRTGGLYTSKRQERDTVHWLSGLKEGVTTGAPLTFSLENTGHLSKDYQDHENIARPSHADYPAQIRYGGHQDKRGGGMFSGRLTAVYVVAGTLCRQILLGEGIKFQATLGKLGSNEIPWQAVLWETIDFWDKRPWLETLEPAWKQRVEEILGHVQEQGDSMGGRVHLSIEGVPVGIGEPQLFSLESELSAWFFSIPGLKALSFGLGEAFADALGSEVNDAAIAHNGQIQHATNNNGGILGGLSNGMPIKVNLTFKPTPSIYRQQNTVDLVTLAPKVLEIRGRHDPAFVIRTPIVVECVAAMCLLDMMRFRLKQERS